MVSEMKNLLDSIATLVQLVSPEKIQVIAFRIGKTSADDAAASLSGVVGTPAAAKVVERLVDSWRATNISASEIASMLLASSHVFSKTVAEQSTELVWTGPTTPNVSARRTEQALLQVINAAEHALFITSFVAYDVSTIVKALNSASDRGVAVSMLLELSLDHGGSITFDSIGKMKALVPSARLYAWRDKNDQFSDGRVHAKVAVADESVCFITSANLTGHAMEKNMEMGVLIHGAVASQVHAHLMALVNMNVVAPI